MVHQKGISARSLASLTYPQTKDKGIKVQKNQELLPPQGQLDPLLGSQQGTLVTMYLSVLLPLLLVTAVPPPSLALLLPPEGNDYPLYDFPSLQYLPHNSLVEYHDPRLLGDDGDRMEVVTRSTYFPVPSSESYTSSSSSSLYPPSSSSSSRLPCTRDDIASLLNMEDLDKVIRIVSMLEGKSVEEILLKLALKHGLHLKVSNIFHLAVHMSHGFMCR